MRKAASLSSLAMVTDSFGQLSDSLLLLDEASAVRLAFDDVNVRRLIQLTWFLAAVNLLYFIVFLSNGHTWRVAVAGVALVGDLWLLRSRRSDWLLDSVREVTSGALLGQLLILQMFHLEASELGGWFVLIPILAARTRLSVGETSALYGAMYAVVALRLVGENLLLKAGLPILELALYLGLVFLPVMGLSVWLSHRREQHFMVRWRSEHDRNRDRLRMKQELEYAREIQLSMLPRQAPRLAWLDLAALSLPATEVGGDYYDYFVLDDQRLAVVLGDVTGHGVASGLVLSGVRSCLNLLQEELVQPAEVLARVNTMLKRTSTPRMLMTLGIAVLDAEAHRLSVATAGHPPLLVVGSTADEVREVGSGSFPLGAVDDVTYQLTQVDLAPDDVILLYSDGLVEAADEQGELYGWQRLSDSFLHAVRSYGSAKDVREAVLRDLWDFKGQVEQQDDVTMVVIRLVDA